MTHLLLRLAERWDRSATIWREEVDGGIAEYSFVDKGSLIQAVADRTLLRDESLLFRGRWRDLEKDYAMQTTWMVRNGWRSRPVVLAWRCSLAGSYFWMGVHYAWRAFLGKETYL